MNLNIVLALLLGGGTVLSAAIIGILAVWISTLKRQLDFSAQTLAQSIRLKDNAEAELRVYREVVSRPLVASMTNDQVEELATQLRTLIPKKAVVN